MATIKIDPLELDDVSRNLGTQHENVSHVLQQINGTVASTYWRSAAADNFRERWMHDKVLLERLAAAFTEWSTTCKKHAEVGRAINKPFR